MKVLYACTMALLMICLVSNIYCLLFLQHSVPFVKALNIITPMVALCFLVAVVNKRRKNMHRNDGQDNANN